MLCRNKFRFNEADAVFELGSVLAAGSCFPYAFGFIPGTKADNGARGAIGNSTISLPSARPMLA